MTNRKTPSKKEIISALIKANQPRLADAVAKIDSATKRVSAEGEGEVWHENRQSVVKSATRLAVAAKKLAKEAGEDLWPAGQNAAAAAFQEVLDECSKLADNLVRMNGAKALQSAIRSAEVVYIDDSNW